MRYLNEWNKSVKVIRVLKICTRGGFVSRGSLVISKRIYMYILQIIHTFVEDMLRDERNIKFSSLHIS